MDRSSDSIGLDLLKWTFILLTSTQSRTKVIIKTKLCLNLIIAVDVPNATKTSKSRVRAIEMLFFGWILNAVHVHVTLESMDLLFHTFQL